MALSKKHHSLKRPGPAGLDARQAAVQILWQVERKDTVLDEALQTLVKDTRWTKLAPRDRAFVRLLVMTVLRHRGELQKILAAHLKKNLPERSGHVPNILLIGAAQLLFLKTPPHAAISLAVEHCKADRTMLPYASLVNAVLRRVSEQGQSPYTQIESVALNIPASVRERWTTFYGSERAHRSAEASLREPPLDLTVKDNPEHWAQLLGGHVLPTGTVRIKEAGVVSELPGFKEGAWWVQDAAAALPAKLLRVSPGMRVADLCAAPGGKTAQLCSMGADVTAVEISSVRLEKIKQNLDRLQLTATLVAADATTWCPASLFDAVLLDAPCSATGTLRRHPDILLKPQQERLEKEIQKQAHLLAHAAEMVRAGGTLLYCTCSLEREEGEMQIEKFLAKMTRFRRVPIASSEIGGLTEALTPEGEVRTLPYYAFKGSEVFEGMDGFFIARLQRIS